jgi:hypothetical protein
VTILNTSINLDSEAFCSRIYRNKARIAEIMAQNKRRKSEFLNNVYYAL